MFDQVKILITAFLLYIINKKVIDTIDSKSINETLKFIIKFLILFTISMLIIILVPKLYNVLGFK